MFWKKNRKFYISVLPVLVGIFLLSVLLRMGNFGRPMSKHHEYCTAVALQVLSVWDESGIGSCGYLPRMNYAGEVNKNINNGASGSGNMVDDEGNYYYISHPPLAYYLPYLGHKVLGVPISVKSIQLFSMFFHFISGLFVYFIVGLISLNRARGKLFIPGVIAFVLYIFLPATLWFQGNVYMSDMLVQTNFIISIYILLKLVMRKRYVSIKYLVWYGISIFLMVYTSWLGVFFGIISILYGVFGLRKTKYVVPLLIATILPMFMALVITAWQYSAIAGWEALLAEWFQRGSVRSYNLGAADNSIQLLFGTAQSAYLLIFNYVANYFTIFVVIVFLFGLFLVKPKLKIVLTRNAYRFLMFSTMPIILLHVVLLNYSGHDFTTLYASVFFAVVFGVFYDKLNKTGVLSKAWINGGLITIIVLMSLQYLVINRPGEVSWNGDRYDVDLKRAEAIAEMTSEEEVVFSNFKPTAQLVYYSGRNVKFVENRAEAEKHLEEYDLSNGRFFFVAEDGGELQSINIEI